MSDKAQLKQVSLGPGAAGANVNIFNKVNSLPSSVLQTIATYTVPVGKEFYLTMIEFFGQNIANYQIWIDNIKEAEKETYYAGPYHGEFFFNNLAIAEGVKIELKAIHESPDLGDFTGRILGGLK